jgi:N-acyl-D-aspartate/D-glutamate deacylase
MAESILIRGGTVIDGTGAPGRTADVLIEDGFIAEVGRIDKAGARKVDADGLLVTPGWVDVHTHYDGQVYWDPLMTPSSWHGSTTAIMGNCGVGFAPARPDRQDALMELMHVIEDIPMATLREGIPWGWETFPEYLDALDRTPRAIDVGVLVPHGAVRTYLMGERGIAEPASPEEIAAICEMIGEAIEAGALGCSANRNMRKAGLVPGSYAADDELLAICRVVGERDGILQTSPASYFGPEEWSPWQAETDLIRRMSLAGKMRLTFPVVQDHDDPDRWRQIMALIRAANADGARLIPQILARPLNAIMTLAGNHPFQKLPAFQKAAEGTSGTAELAARLRDRGMRESILGEAHKLLADQGWFFGSLYHLGDPVDYEPDPARSFSAEARKQGLSPIDYAYDALSAGDGTTMFLAVVANYAPGNAEVVFEMINDPETIIGLGDGGAHCLGLLDVTTPTTVLTQWVRDRTRGPRLPLEVAVRELSASTARAFGLYDRGVLAQGMRADVNLIDLDNLQMGRPHFADDLPAGGRRLVQRATGYVATFVRGEQILANGEDTGARPGRTIRRSAQRVCVTA